MSTVTEIFGQDVFDSRVMKAVLPSDVYKKLNETINEGKQLDEHVANEVASAMRNWAVAKGATHYTHWFQPMTGITAEKHDGFISPTGDGGIIMDFSGKELIKGEPDASSFPSGGLRSTFEARGYTAWDPTSYAFIKGNTLCIPTAFCGFNGEALDQKTPLLRSLEALNTQATRVLKLFGQTGVKRVIPMVGPEQEYFLVDKKVFEKRRDLCMTGRTLFGAKPPKGQELDDHYFGAIKPRVQEFMSELNEALWRLGIPAKTEHNEVAPAQHELAPIYERCSIATDHNQLTMEIMKKIAAKHDLVCLLHEKPFDGVNGSGKHNNWSIATDDGQNLLSPGKTPYENAQFLLFLVAVIKAVDDYQDLLRVSVASAQNDHRLGASEAPPAIVSIFLGDELYGILDAIDNDSPYAGTEKKLMQLGVDAIPGFTRDTTDRNRTSPLAFTGNKFEFRMLGSSDSIATANVMLNSAVADTLRIFAEKLEAATDFETELHELIKATIKEHKRILFNGNGYDDSWVIEATEKRGLLNLKTTPDAIPSLLKEKNIALLTGLGVFTETEIRSRYEIRMEVYGKTVLIEANTMVDMAKKEIMPAIASFVKSLCETVALKKTIGTEIAAKYEIGLVEKLSNLLTAISEATAKLEADIAASKGKSADDTAFYVRDVILKDMADLRAAVDEAEQNTSERYWPFPSYEKLLFSVK